MSEFSSLVELSRHRALHQPELPVYTFLVDGENEEQTFNCFQLDSQARRIAAHLQQLNLKGERALLLYPPGLEYIAAFFGCLYAGVVAVPAYPPDPTRLSRTLPRLQAIVKDSEAACVLTLESIQSMAETIFEQAPDLGKLRWIATDQFEESLGEAWVPQKISSDTLAFLQYTSGSTGTPKGVLLSHGNLIYNSSLIAEAYEHHSKSQGVIWLPPYHDMGLIGGIIQPLYKGFSCTLMSPLAFLQKPVRWLQAITRYQATTSGGPNFAYELCIRKVTEEQITNLDLSSWSLAFTGAEPIRSETLDRFVEQFKKCGFQKSAFYPCYGLAEATLIVSGGKKGEPIKTEKLCAKSFELLEEDSPTSKEIVACGKNLKGQNIAIVDPASSKLCNEGEIGEIWVSGPSISLGYWNQKEETDYHFQARLEDSESGPYLRTGDLGFLKDDHLFVTGRLKDLIIIRGQNHYPQDIELTVEQSHSALRTGCGALFSVEVNSEEQLIVAYELEKSVTLNNSEEADLILSSIQKAVSEQHGLQVYAIALLKTGTVPKTSSGKISRYASKQAFLEGTLESVVFWKREFENPELENALAEVISLTPPTRKQQQIGEKEIKSWLINQLADRLRIKLDEIDTTRSFVSYGLDSKDAVNLSGEIEDWLRCSFSPSLLWQYPTVDSLTHHLTKMIQIVSLENQETDLAFVDNVSPLVVEN